MQSINRRKGNPVFNSALGLVQRKMAETIGCAALLSLVLPAHALIFFSTGDPSYNTNAPRGALTNSGWQYQGTWSTFTGTVISTNAFITAKHVGGSVGDLFTFQGVQYTTTAAFESPDCDLRIWRVAGQFPVFAPLYTRSTENGKNVVVIGRGTQRGVEVRINNRLKGWEWGAGDSVQRWGQNKISGIFQGGAEIGEVLRASFNPGGRNEAMLSAGDSGGAVFIKDGKIWKLAGINYAVEGPYNTTNSGVGFNAAIFDSRGLYITDGGAGWLLFSGKPIAGNFYATRISAHVNWITNVLAMPAP
jgi:Trypsin